MKSFIIFCFALMAMSPAQTQELRESDEFNPIFDLYDAGQNKQTTEKDTYIKIKLGNILSKNSMMKPFWMEEIRNRNGHFFMMEAEHKLDNGYKMIFSQFRSNLTCANFGEYTEPNQGNENCFTKMFLIAPDMYRTLQLDNIWMNGNGDFIYLKPEQGKEFPDILANDVWYQYKPSINKYVMSTIKN